MKAKNEKLFERALYIVFILYVIFIGVTPLKELRSNIVVNVCENIALSALILYFSWWRYRKPCLIGRVAATVLGMAFIWIPMLLQSNRALSLLSVILTASVIAVLVYALLSQKETRTTSNLILYAELYVFIQLMNAYSDIMNEVNGTENLHFRSFSLIFTAIIVLLAVLVIKSKRFPAKGIRQTVNSGGITFLAVLLLILTSLIASYTSLENLNFALDTSEPTPYVCEILDKNMSNGIGRHKHAYRRIKVDLNGSEMWFDIISSQYDRCEVGDSVTVNLYEGFFGMPYLIMDGIG